MSERVDMIRIRRGKRKDFEALAGLPRSDAQGAEIPYRWYVKILKDLNHDLYVAEAAGKILGFSSVGYFKSIHDRGRRAVIECVRTTEDADPRVVMMLVEHALRRVKKKECRRVEANVAALGPELLRQFGLTEESRTLSMPLVLDDSVRQND